MENKRLTIKDKEIRSRIRNKKRKDFKKDFFELLKRASKTNTR